MPKARGSEGGNSYLVLARSDDELEHRLRLLATAIRAVHGQVIAVVRLPSNAGQANAEVHYVVSSVWLEACLRG